MLAQWTSCLVSRKMHRCALDPHVVSPTPAPGNGAGREGGHFPGRQEGGRSGPQASDWVTGHLTFWNSDSSLPEAGWDGLEGYFHALGLGFSNLGLGVQAQSRKRTKEIMGQPRSDFTRGIGGCVGNLAHLHVFGILRFSHTVSGENNQICGDRGCCVI